MTWPAALVIFYTAAAVPILWHRAVDLSHRLIEIAVHTTNNTDLSWPAVWHKSAQPTETD